MSYTIPGRDPGVRSTEEPSTPCTGDFIDKLHCRDDNGWFLWVGAFCVLVVICALCSCFVVTPISRFLRRLLGTDDDSKRKAVIAHAKSYEDANAKKPARRKGNLNSPPSQTLPEHNHHWYLDDVLKITHEDEMELGPRSPAYTVPTAKSPTASSLVQQRQEESSARRSSMSSNRAASNRSMLYVPRRDGCNRTRERERALAASYRHHSRRLTAAVVVDDPGIGAEATLRGGGWMGADNGRL